MEKKPNRLIHETSPYLLQHAYNPVDWYPWGKEAFQKAKKENKMIFLSIGYSTCHWCHVMEKESFEDEEIAKILNEHFVPIKVDREELPDVDHIYMTAIQLMGIQGGWPLNVFLTPDLKPITGGTYFPPLRKWGMPSFKEILLKMIDLWKKNQKELIQLSEEIHFQLKQFTQKNKNSIEIDVKTFLSIPEYFYQYFDEKKGGFLVNGRNKFPPSLNLFLLNIIYKKHKSSKILQMLEKTLYEMRLGGIYDQIGGGISRYSTDHQWLIPHFEKMLYDNALFTWINLEVYKTNKNQFYLNTAIDVLEYLFRDMHNPEGGFYSAEDADSEGEEGKFYVWSKEEFILALKNDFTEQEIQQLIKYFNITEEGNFESKNVLSINPNVQLDNESIKKARKILLQYRNLRTRPHRDEKILTSWNALMISTLSHAYLTTMNEFYLNEAKKTSDFIFKHLATTNDYHQAPKECIFYRSYSNHQKKIAPYVGTLTDHASMACAMLDLYKSTGNPEYLRWAKYLKDFIIKYYYDGGVLYETKDHAPDLILRSSDFYDGVLPSGLSFSFRLFVHLYFYGIDMDECEKIMSEILQVYFNQAINQPFSYSYFLMSIFKLYFMNQQIVISTKNDQILKEILSNMGKYLNSESIIGYNYPDIDAKDILLLKDKSLPENIDYSLYICENFSCQFPLNDINQIVPEKIL